MKIHSLFFTVFIVILFFVAGCTKNEQNQQSADGNLEFKKMCIDSGNEWMKMKPTQNGKFIKDAKECWGCMVEGIEHICDKEKFVQLIGKNE